MCLPAYATVKSDLFILVRRPVPCWSLGRFFTLLLAATLLGAEDTERITKALISAAQAFRAAAPSFHAEEIMRYRKAAGRNKWDTGATIAEYGFAADGQTVRETRRIVRSSGTPDAKPTVSEAGQILLLFESSTIGRYVFHHSRTAYVGPVAADVWDYRQQEGPDTVTITDRKKKVTAQTNGEVWVDSASYRLLRVTMDTEHKDVRDHIEVDYVYTPTGAPMPVSALHRQFHSDVVGAETLVAYRWLSKPQR